MLRGSEALRLGLGEFAKVEPARIAFCIDEEFICTSMEERPWGSKFDGNTSWGGAFWGPSCQTYIQRVSRKSQGRTRESQVRHKGHQMEAPDCPKTSPRKLN